ncbi:MAG: hypothetical protein PVH22_07445, partial [Desulfobacteraceae bacterium]
RFTNKTARGTTTKNSRSDQSHVFDLFLLAFNGLQAPLGTRISLEPYQFPRGESRQSFTLGILDSALTFTGWQDKFSQWKTDLKQTRIVSGGKSP